MKTNLKYPLLSNAFNSSDIRAGISVLQSKKITMSKITKRFEKNFAKKIGSKFALMTNSGSSANLLAVSVISNLLSKKRLKKDDEVIIPAVCWSTSLWPIVQNNLKPVFVDVEPHTMNIDINDLKKKIRKKTKAVMCIHVLGTSTNMNTLMKIIKKKNLILIEDTCESLGAKYNNKHLGTFGRFGTYSFYYSHQITSGEGGMIVCNDLNDYNLLKSMRSHGWSRDTNLHKKLSNKYKNLDNRFLFISPGYNLRPTDVQAAIAANQFKRLKNFMKIRNYNRNIIISNLKKHPNWDNQFKFVEVQKDLKPSWFGLPIMIDQRFEKNKKKFLNFLLKKGIENRPIISGNFLNQPASKLYKFTKNKSAFKNAQLIEKLGFFIGLHTQKIKTIQVNYLVNNLIKINRFK